MSEREKLHALRKMLVSKRRAMVDTFLSASLEQLTGESIARIQGAIDAVDHAIADEKAAAESGLDIGLAKSDPQARPGSDA